jgi:transcriptional regulator with XRE-family HTH domain
MYRKRSGLSQSEIAELLGCQHGSKVSRYERSARCPGLETLLAYEVIFSGSGREFFEGRYANIERDVRLRAQKLFKRFDSEPGFTALTKRKMDFLTDLIYPPKSKDQ